MPEKLKITKTQKELLNLMERGGLLTAEQGAYHYVVCGRRFREMTVEFLSRRRLIKKTDHDYWSFKISDKGLAWLAGDLKLEFKVTKHQRWILKKLYEGKCLLFKRIYWEDLNFNESGYTSGMYINEDIVHDLALESLIKQGLIEVIEKGVPAYSNGNGYQLSHSGRMFCDKFIK